MGKIILCCILFLVNSPIYSEETQALRSKEIWLQQFSELIGPAICEKLEKSGYIFDASKEANNTHEACLAIANNSLKKCIPLYSNLIPAMVDSAARQYWGGQLGGCIGHDFDAYPISKEAWLEQFTEAMVPAMCEKLEKDKLTSAVMKGANITHEKCIAMTSDDLKKCIIQYSNQIPSALDLAAKHHWGKTLGGCVGRDFDAYFTGPSTGLPVFVYLFISTGLLLIFYKLLDRIRKRKK